MFNPLFRKTNTEAAARSTRTLLALAALTALTGCASMQDRDPSSPPPDAPLRAEMRVDHALPAISTGRSEDPEEMVDGSVRLGTPKGLLDYGARYQVRQGRLFQAIRNGDDDLEQTRAEVAVQSLEQTLGSTLNLPAGAPVTLQLTRREDTRLGVDSESTKQSTRADLRWSAGSIDLHVEWTRPDHGSKSTSGVNCDLRAGVQLPAEFLPVPTGSVLEISGQRCLGSSPTHGMSEVPLARWGAAWRWGAEQNTALHLLRTEPEIPAGANAPLTPDYELGLSHRHVLPGGWQARADVAVLRADPAVYALRSPTGSDRTDWTARLALKRDLHLLAVTARWAHAAERAWFATATKQLAGDRFSLALDFGAWLSRLWPRVDSAMDLSWDWRRTRQGHSDSKLNWKMLIDW